MHLLNETDFKMNLLLNGSNPILRFYYWKIEQFI